MFVPSENSRASVILGYVKDHMIEVGDLLTYTEMLGLIEVDPSIVPDPPTLLSGIVAQINKRLHQAGDWRHMINVPTVGYRIAAPGEIREEVLGRMRHVDRQQVNNLRAIEKVVRHPDTTPAERKRAADAVSAQQALLTMVRREQTKIRNAWPAEESSPIPGPVAAT
jgi:hypothetical protein